jgi:TRAP-type uncharacterized transport system substrate-binding protein
MGVSTQALPNRLSWQLSPVDRDTFLPFHPGAVRYYREIGVAIPAALAARGGK